MDHPGPLLGPSTLNLGPLLGPSTLNPNEELHNIGNMDIHNLEEDSSDNEFMNDESATSVDSQFFVEEDNMDVYQQGLEPLE